jgi:hypothetical protein
MKVTLTERLLTIAAWPFVALLSLVLVFGLKDIEEEERQRQLDT